MPIRFEGTADVSGLHRGPRSAAVAMESGRIDVIEPLTSRWQHELVARMVAEGPGVDGPSGEAVVGVDGLSIDDYLVPWCGIRSELGLA